MLQQQLVIGLDCSTTATKAIAFDASGRIVAQAHEPLPLASPRPHYYEQHADDWWRSASHALAEVTRQVDPLRIVALGIANQRETFVPLDASGIVLRPAIVWLDERCKDEVEPFARAIGKKKIHRITGKPPDYAPVVYRLAWMKKHEPERFRKIGMICDVHAYIAWKLTGAFKTSWASADPLGLLNMKTKRWSSAVLDALRLREHQLPAVCMPGSVLGRLGEQASRETGLNGQVIVVAGGGDGQCAGLGSNALSTRRAYLNLGTAVVAGVYAPDYTVDTAYRTMCACAEGGYYCECSLRAGTFAIDWFVRRILGADPARDRDIYRKLEEEAREIEAGCDGLMFLPYLCGVMNPHWDMYARGAFVGLAASHHRGHMYRSILEGIAFEQRFALDAVERSLDVHVRELAAIGGGTSSALWCQILADVTGRTMLFPSSAEASALGAAIAAAVGAGWYPTFPSAAKGMTGIARTMKPDLRRRRLYQRLFPAYERLYPSLDN